MATCVVLLPSSQLDQGSGGPKQGLWGWLVEQEAMHGQRRVLLLVVYIYEGVYECVCLV